MGDLVPHLFTNIPLGGGRLGRGYLLFPKYLSSGGWGTGQAKRGVGKQRVEAIRFDYYFLTLFWIDTRPFILCFLD